MYIVLHEYIYICTCMINILEKMFRCRVTLKILKRFAKRDTVIPSVWSDTKIDAVFVDKFVWDSKDKYILIWSPSVGWLVLRNWLYMYDRNMGYYSKFNILCHKRITYNCSPELQSSSCGFYMKLNDAYPINLWVHFYIRRLAKPASGLRYGQIIKCRY